jgi:hypothetical protein
MCGREGISVTGTGSSEDLVAALNFALANADTKALDECEKMGAGCLPHDRAKALDCECETKVRYRLVQGSYSLFD